ncbi:VOC family protein [Sphingomonas koreensis]|nr:VOC family protein [Sphingomonas koreensis]
MERIMTVSMIKRVSVPVSDQRKAQTFYEGLLGLKVLRDDPVPMGENARWLEVGSTEQDSSIVLVSWFPVAPGTLQGLMLESDDLDGDGERLTSAGYPVDGPNTTPWGRQLSVRDPDGNGLVLVERP